LIIAIGTFQSCKKGNPVVTPVADQPQASLTLEDASCTEAWIKLSTENLSLPADAELYKDSSLAGTINLITEDTVLYVDSLLPNQTYNFHTIIHPYNHTSQLTSSQLPVTTMDTTSHNFTWQTWTFGGQIGSSALYDVTIINENDIWAVGEIYIVDTTSLGYTLYNAVHWNGNQWELKRILYNESIWTISTIFSFNRDDIWFSAFVHYNGKDFVDLPIPGVLTGWGINRIWGTSDNNLYVVGNNGNIAHFDGQSWTKIESGTDLDINDIYGAYNDNTNEWEILAVASDYPESINKEILQLKNNNCIEISANPISWPLFSVWFIPGRMYYVAGSGIYQKHLLENNEWRNDVLDITTYTTTSINGNGINDVVAVGAFGDLVHFNGINWKNDYVEPLLSNGSYTRVAMKGDLLVAVGGNHISINSEAVILMGRR
jgi:hypothetical protein